MWTYLKKLLNNISLIISRPERFLLGLILSLFISHSGFASRTSCFIAWSVIFCLGFLDRNDLFWQSKDQVFFFLSIQRPECQYRNGHFILLCRLVEFLWPEQCTVFVGLNNFIWLNLWDFLRAETVIVYCYLAAVVCLKMVLFLTFLFLVLLKERKKSNFWWSSLASYCLVFQKWSWLLYSLFGLVWEKNLSGSNYFSQLFQALYPCGFSLR